MQEKLSTLLPPFPLFSSIKNRAGVGSSPKQKEEGAGEWNDRSGVVWKRGGGNGSIREGGKEKEEKGLAAMKNSLGEPERSIHQRIPLNTKCNVFFCVRHLFKV